MAMYSGPMETLALIQSGLRSTGVAALRASMRSILRPSGASVTVLLLLRRVAAGI